MRAGRQAGEDSDEFRRATVAFRAAMGRNAASLDELNRWWEGYIVQAGEAFEAVNGRDPIGMHIVELVDWFERHAVEAEHETEQRRREEGDRVWGWIDPS